MRISWLAAILASFLLSLPGCDGSANTTNGKSSTETGGAGGSTATGKTPAETGETGGNTATGKTPTKTGGTGGNTATGKTPAETGGTRNTTVEKTSTAAGGSGAQTTTEKPEHFEIEGSWLYLGPWDGPHTLEITSESVQYADTDNGWSSTWSIKEYDNGLHRFELVFKTGEGEFSPSGQNLSATYVLNNGILTVQLADGLEAFQPVESPGSCTTEESDLIPDCKIYMQQQ